MRSPTALKNSALVGLGAFVEYAYRFTQDGERYYGAYGFTAHGRYLTVGYVERGDKIRPVTAWDMTRNERKVYDAKKIDQQRITACPTSRAKLS